MESRDGLADSPSPADSIIVGAFLFAHSASRLLIVDFQLQPAPQCLEKKTT